MHWTAATGTSYTPIPNSANYPSGRWTVVVVAVIVIPIFRGDLMTVILVLRVPVMVRVSSRSDGEKTKE